VHAAQVVRGAQADEVHRFPDLDEVLGDPHEAFSRRKPPPRGLPGGGERQSEEPSDPPRHPDVEFTPRAHLRLFVALELAPELDAGNLLGLSDGSS